MVPETILEYHESFQNLFHPVRSQQMQRSEFQDGHRECLSENPCYQCRYLKLFDLHKPSDKILSDTFPVLQQDDAMDNPCWVNGGKFLEIFYHDRFVQDYIFDRVIYPNATNRFYFP